MVPILLNTSVFNRNLIVSSADTAEEQSKMVESAVANAANELQKLEQEVMNV